MKKIFLIFTINSFLLLSFLWGQMALAADEACTAVPPTGYGGSCQNITCPTTAGSTPLAELDSSKHDECISEYAGSAKECATGKCTGEWYRVCCRAKTTTSSTCTAPNSCTSTDACPGAQNRVPNKTCPDSKVCCKPDCLKCADSSTGCPDGWHKAQDQAKYKSCDTGQICCEAGAGTGSTGSETFDLGQQELSPVGNVDIPTLIGFIVKGALGIIGSIALLMFIYGGFIMLISQGDPTKITKGKTAMVWAAIGLIAIFGSYIFVSYIISGLTESGGGSDGGDSCGTGIYEGYSCMDKSQGTGCVVGLCPGGKDNQCCKPK